LVISKRNFIYIICGSFAASLFIKLNTTLPWKNCRNLVRMRQEER